MGEQAVLTSKMRALMILAVAGFGLLQGSRLLDQGSGPYSSQPFVLAGIIAGGVCCILLALLSYFANLNDIRPVFAASLVLMAVRMAFSLAPGASEAAIFLSQISAGIGWMLVLLCWMQVFVSYRPLYSIPMIAIGYLIDLATVPVTNALFPESKQAVFFVIFCLSILALGLCLANNRLVAATMIDDEPLRTSKRELVVRTGTILFAIFALTVPCGFIVQADILGNLQYVQNDLTALLGMGATVILLVLLLIFRPKKKTIDVAYPVSGICLVLILGYRVASVGDTFAAGSLMAAFLMTFFGVFWVTFVQEAYERRLPAFFLLGLAVGVAQLSLGGGRLLAIALQGSAVMENEATIVAGGVSFLAITACAVVAAGLVGRLRTDGATATEAALGAPAAEPEGPHASGADFPPASASMPTVVSFAALELLQQTYGLSKREFQVITDYSTGRSARYIADMLMLSEHTIKSHLRRAYAKMDVHSRQELLSLVDHMEASIHAGS